MHKGDGFSAKTLEESLFFKMTDLAMVQPASSNFWKADPVSSKGNICVFDNRCHDLSRLFIPDIIN